MPALQMVYLKNELHKILQVNHRANLHEKAKGHLTFRFRSWLSKLPVYIVMIPTAHAEFPASLPVQ